VQMNNRCSIIIYHVCTIWGCFVWLLYCGREILECLGCSAGIWNISYIYGIITMQVHTVHLQNCTHEYRNIKLSVTVVEAVTMRPSDIQFRNFTCTHVKKSWIRWCLFHTPSWWAGLFVNMYTKLTCSFAFQAAVCGFRWIFLFQFLELPS
jgi:hypothetical protein